MVGSGEGMKDAKIKDERVKGFKFKISPLIITGYSPLTIDY
jgi:hypothetical protein